MRDLLAWWMSARIDKRVAVALVLTIWTLGAVVWVVDPAAPHPSP